MLNIKTMQFNGERPRFVYMSTTNSVFKIVVDTKKEKIQIENKENGATKTRSFDEACFVLMVSGLDTI